ncbi:Peptidase C19, ubiquitin carboxyl-terminal hydrolase 2 [Artemisia annua]|uniref:ubiquitinyl hydrolase 1 n=1 Tax=Artemisia annua TaxID=35608 RepID=A0A2U1PMR2_ARTAN|nr:Peptidase C19, ubiquitin carboxyl-terminal hydrolase 2 [Artemisia annua]
MGKKIKKAARNAQKEKRFPTTSPKTVLQETVSATKVAANEELSVSQETETCPHLDNGINLKKFSTRILSVESLKCEDCRKGVGDKSTKKGKNKQGKNKVNGSKAEAIWVCLECAHFSCGGIGLPTIPNGHAAQHAKAYRHPLALQFANPKLRWCFPCNALIPVQNFAENEEQKDSLSEFVEILKNLSSSSSITRVGIRDSWFESGSVRSRLQLVNTLPHCLDNTGGYMVRGLMNLGNTCFFNSVLQNLLSIDKLREHLLNLDGFVGPLTMSLKKLFVETSLSAGVRNVVDPRSLLGCVCMKSPQFKGFRQHDSHELLRCLLDGLSTEESCVIKRSQNGNGSLKHASTFVDNIFGGQISSTVSCLECGHASVVYEPYLDLSLPLPTKRVPPKTTALVSRSKKQKPPPKRQGKFWPKNKKESSFVQFLTNTSSSEPTMEIEENTTSSGDTILSESVLDSACDINDSGLLDGIKHDVTKISTSEATMSIDETATSSGDPVLSKFDVLDSAGHRNGSGLLNGIKHDETITTHDYTIATHDDTITTHDDTITISDTHDQAAINSLLGFNGHGTTTHLGDDIVTEHDVANTVEASMHVDSIDADLTWLDNLEHDVSTVEDMLSHNQYSSVQDFGTSNKFKLAYDTRQEPSYFDAFECLYDDPSVYAGPTAIPFSYGFRGSGYMATSYSDSDPDEVDDTDSSLSVEKCLAYFTTPELLTKTEHAWQCEKCAKSLLDQKTRLKNETQKPVINGHENGNSNASSDSAVEHLLPNCDSNLNDRGTKNGDLALHNGKSDQSTDNGDLALHNGKSDQSTHDGDLALHNGKSDQSTENGDLALHNGKSDQSTKNGDLALHNGKSDQSTDNDDLALHNGKSDDRQDIECCSDNGSADKFENENGQERESDSSEDEEVDSRNVKVVRDASKRILISRAPRVLTIHLKRFSQDAHGRLSKINGHVNFGETVDLKPYMDPSCCKDRETSYKYRLIGVVEHSGTMRCGHYVAYVKRGAKGNAGKDENESSMWYYASDAYVREASLEEVLRCEAYILFYEEM